MGQVSKKQTFLKTSSEEIEELRMKRNETRTYRASKMSADDNRTSSKIMGLVACAFLSLGVLIIVGSDLTNFVNVQLRKTKSGKLKF